MEFKQKTLSNGLTIIAEENRFAKSAAVGFFVRTGARDESEKINGVSHFLEHMLFKGTDKLSAVAVNEAFDKTGAQFNAYTSEEMTVFFAAVVPEYLVEVTNLWIELMRPALRDEDFNLEKKVIAEEIAMYKDTPSFDVIDRCRNLYFGQHPCGHSVLGSAESIQALTAENMRRYFAGQYAPNNMVLAFAGNFAWDEVSAIVEDGCSRWHKQSLERKIADYRGGRKKQRIDKANLNREHICLMSACVSAQDVRRYAALLLAGIVGDDVGSRFFWGLVDRALAETAVMQFMGMDGTGAFCSYIRCGAEKVSQVLETVKDIFAGLSEKGVDDEELAAAKNKILSMLVIKNKLPMGRLADLGLNWTYLQQYREIGQEISAIKAVAVDDVNALIREFQLGDFTRFSIGPPQ